MPHQHIVGHIRDDFLNHLTHEIVPYNVFGGTLNATTVMQQKNRLT